MMPANEQEIASRLVTRLRTYAKQTCNSSECVVSIKFRPVAPGANNTDPFGYNDANAYMYPSEYNAGQETNELSISDAPRDNLVMDISDTVRYPFPWEGTSIWQIGDNQSNVLWIQHETGLEILGAIADILEILGVIAILFERIRNKIKSNKTDSNSDRHNREVNILRIEIRMLENGSLKQDLAKRESINICRKPRDIQEAIKKKLRII